MHERDWIDRLDTPLTVLYRRSGIDESRFEQFRLLLSMTPATHLIQQLRLCRLASVFLYIYL